MGTFKNASQWLKLGVPLIEAGSGVGFAAMFMFPLFSTASVVSAIFNFVVEKNGV